MNHNTTEQIYDNGVLLGALLRITGLSIFEVQSIIQGNLILGNKYDNIRSLLLEGAEWKTTFCLRLLNETMPTDINTILSDLNNIFKSNFGLNEFNSGVLNSGFYFNSINFSLSNTFEIREKFIALFKSDKYHFTDNKIAKILEISPTTVGKIVKEISSKK